MTQAPARSVRDTGSAASRPYVNVGQTERLGSIVGGGLLAAYGLVRGTLGGLALAAVGGRLIYRGATGHCPMYGALHLSTAGRGPATGVPAGAGCRVDESVTVNRPAAELFRFWRDFENLPRFMPGLRSVAVEDNRSHWIAEAPMGASVSWDAEIINEREDELIAWRSLPGSAVDTAGSVHFQRIRDGAGTELHVEMKYNPPAGKAGAAFAWLFGDDPKQQVREALHTFKQLMEGGERLTT
jgi:uncharacterized membrane protein